MAQVKTKGSIVLEILIVVLIVALIATLLYPKKVWEEEDRNMKICRSNMDRIFKAELVYQKYHYTYTDSMPELVNFIKNDSTKMPVRDYFYADTALAEEMVDFLREKDSNANQLINDILADTLMWAIIETIDYDSNLARVILNRLESTALGDSVKAKRMGDSSDVYVLKELRNQFSAFQIYNPIKDDDSLKLVFARMIPEISTGSLLDTLYISNEEWAQKIDSAVFYTLDHFTTCPTVGKEYKITVIDTSVIKYVNIECPIDSTDIEGINRDFVKYHFGHLRLKNHGKIINSGEKSWAR